MSENQTGKMPCKCTQENGAKSISTDGVNQVQSHAAMIDDLKRQRCEFAKIANEGNSHVLPSIDFIDNVLSQFIPDYIPPKGKGCCCGDK